jgi:hypothetical protein
MTGRVTIKLLSLVSFIIAISLAAIMPSIFASVSSYTASKFSQYCEANQTICKKAELNSKQGDVSCPSSEQVINSVYVHAGEGQTVYELPDDKFSYSYSNNQNTVTVTSSDKDLSWIAVVCEDVQLTPTPTTEQPTPTPTDVVVRKVSPALECIEFGEEVWIAYWGYNNPNESSITIEIGGQNEFVPGGNLGQPTSFDPGRKVKIFSTTQTPSTNLVWKLNGKTATSGSKGKPCPTEEPTPTPTTEQPTPTPKDEEPTPTPVQPTATPTPGANVNPTPTPGQVLGGSTEEPKKEVLGVKALAATGTFSTSASNIIFYMGLFFIIFSLTSYVKQSKKQ